MQLLEPATNCQVRRGPNREIGTSLEHPAHWMNVAEAREIGPVPYQSLGVFGSHRPRP